MKVSSIIKLFTSFVFVLLFLSSAWAQCQCLPQARLITVTGDAEVKVVPNEVIFSIGVVTSDKNLEIAKSQNTEVVKKVLALTKEYKIDTKDVQTDYINISPRYEREYEQRHFIGYFVNQNIVITLKDISKFDNFLSSLLQAGVTNVKDVGFRTTELRKYKDQARALAVKAAKEKADALAKELGQKVSRPYAIKEEPVYSWSGLAQQNVSRGAYGESEDISSGFALGQINIKAKITASFELE